MVGKLIENSLSGLVVGLVEPIKILVPPHAHKPESHPSASIVCVEGAYRVECMSRGQISSRIG